MTNTTREGKKVQSVNEVDTHDDEDEGEKKRKKKSKTFYS